MAWDRGLPAQGREAGWSRTSDDREPSGTPGPISPWVGRRAEAGGRSPKEVPSIMQLVRANTGSYPRIGDTPAAQRHRRAYAQRERGELSAADWRTVEDEITREVIGEQIAAGVELPTDGQVRWYDPISHLARGLTNVTVNG